jgi:hypothetical protein
VIELGQTAIQSPPPVRVVSANKPASREALSQLTYWPTAPVAVGANDLYRGAL